MYLYITEDGTVSLKIGPPDKVDLDSANEGLLTVLDITDPTRPQEYYDGAWTEIPVHEGW